MPPLSTAACVSVLTLTYTPRYNHTCPHNYTHHAHWHIYTMKTTDD